ncbi:30S ribosomal protein S18 [Candidatus Giovannonibacteria bacterium]|nr:30S ribosomal protein S18 [Candidatus Giovannonibacteria bacterium]
MELSKQCYFCAANIKAIDYKSQEVIRKFMTPQAQIVKKRRSGVCALHQRKLAEAIKRARFLGLAPYTTR